MPVELYNSQFPFSVRCRHIGVSIPLEKNAFHLFKRRFCDTASCKSFRDQCPFLAHFSKHSSMKDLNDLMPDNWALAITGEKGTI